jgi:hypothetical protein
MGTNDQKTVQMVIGFLGLIALNVVLGGMILAYTGKPIPSEIVALGSAALGAVAGILAKTSVADPVQQVSGPGGGAVETVDVAPLAAKSARVRKPRTAPVETQ